MIAEIEQGKTARAEMSSDYWSDSSHDNFLCKTGFENLLLQEFCIFRASAWADQDRLVSTLVNAGSHDVEETLDGCLAAMNGAETDKMTGVIDIADRLKLQQSARECSNIGKTSASSQMIEVGYSPGVVDVEFGVFKPLCVIFNAHAVVTVFCCEIGMIAHASGCTEGIDDDELAVREFFLELLLSQQRIAVRGRHAGSEAVI